MGSDLTEDDLRLRYLDWCSSRVARRFLELSHDEVWLRSHLAAALDPEAPGTAVGDRQAAGNRDRVPGYLELVRKTAVLLASEMNLPSFEEWKAAYAAEPARFDLEVLGGSG